MKLTSPAGLRAAVAFLAIVGSLWIWIPRTEIRFVFSPDAEGLLTPLIEEFNKGQRDIKVIGAATSSGSAMNNIIDTFEPEAETTPEQLPELWMPAASTWGLILNAELDQDPVPMGGGAIGAPSFFWSPEVIATYPSVNPPLRGWEDLVARARSAPPAGETPFRLGHTNPETSTSGLYALLSEYDAVDPTGDMTRDEVVPEVSEIERTVLHYGDIARDFCSLLTQKVDGAYVSAVYMQETTLLECEEEQGIHLEEVFNESGTYVADYPCIIFDASWTTPAEAAAASTFRDWLGDRLDQVQNEDQTVTEANGYRFGNPWDEIDDEAPADASDVELEAADLLQIPTTTTLIGAREAWPAVRKDGNVLILLEKSGMNDENLMGAAKRLLIGESNDAEDGGLVDLLPDDTFVSLATFDTNLSTGAFESLDDETRGELEEEIYRVGSNSDPSTLFDSVAEAVQVMRHRDPDGINVIVLLSRGEDSASDMSEDQLLLDLKATSESRVPVQLFAISFGSKDGDALLEEIAGESLGQFADAVDPDPDSDNPTPEDLLMNSVAKMV